ncbi:unnamed protein product [Symbiodinium sp. CCMP2592]|nr:unnamed protein product [Symbiodinium sp. CCMP2592]
MAFSPPSATTRTTTATSAICAHQPNCVSASLGPNGCFQARYTEEALRDMRDGQVAPVSDRHWLPRQLGGRVCRLAGAADCKQGTMSEDHRLRFSELQPDWLERHAELKLSLGLAEGSQELPSDSEGLQLKLGPPDILDVLVNLTGITHDGETVYFNATAAVEQEDVVVTLFKYPPYQLTELHLYLTVLFPDPDYAADWSDSTASLVNSTEVSFRRCDESRLFRHRYLVCQAGNQGWRSLTAKIALAPWDPTETSAFFDVRSSASGQEKGLSLRRSVKLRLHEVASVGAWAVPPEQNACTFLGTPADLHANTSEETQAGSGSSPLAALDFDSPSLQQIRRAAATGAACEFTKRGCRKVHSHAFGESVAVSKLVLDTEATSIVIKLFRDYDAFRRAGLDAADDSDRSAFKSMIQESLREAIPDLAPALWRAFRCMLQANASLAGSCRPCGGFLNTSEFLCCGSEEHLRGFLQLDFLPGLPPGWPLAASKLPAILHGKPDDTDDLLLKLTCTALLAKPGSGSEEAQPFEDNMLNAAIKAANLQALNLTLRHCRRSDNLAKKQAQAIWQLSSQGLPMLQLMWKEFPQHLNALLQNSVDDRCEVCLMAWHASEPAGACDRASGLTSNVSLILEEASGGGDIDPALGVQESRDFAQFLGQLVEAPPCLLSAVSHLRVENIQSIESAKAAFKLLTVAAKSVRDLELRVFFESRLRGGYRDEDVADLVESVQRLGQLRSLVLDSVSFDDSMEGLARALLRKVPHLNSVTLRSTSVSARELADSLKTSSDSRPCQLQKIIRAEARYEEEEEAKALVDGLTHCKALIYVDLCGEASSLGNNASEEIRQVVRGKPWNGLRAFRIKSEKGKCIDISNPDAASPS